MRHGICWDNQKGKRAGLYARQCRGWYQCLLLFVGASLCMCSAYMQLRDVYPQLRLPRIPGEYGAAVLLLAAVLAVVYGSGVLRFWWLRLLPALPVGWCLYHYYEEYRLPVEDGSLYVARCYVTELCRFFKVSLFFPNGLVAEVPRALLFWSLLLLGAFFILAAVFRAYWLLLVIPGTLLAAGIAVGKSPGWGSLFVLLAAGVVLTGRWAQLPDRWYVRTAQLAGVLCICIITGALCGALPQRVVGMHGDVQEKQLALEDAALSLPVWGMFRQHGTVDNHRPGGTGREVLSVWLSDEPTENVYLKDYAASRYENGRWTEDPAPFAAAAQEQGMEASTAGGQLLSRVYDGEADVFNLKKEIDFLSSGGWSVAQPRQHGYEITCRDFGSSAPLPYAGRLPENLSMDGDRAAKKSWSQKRYSGSFMMGGSVDDPLIDYLEMYYAVKQWGWIGDHFYDLASSSINLKPENAGHDWYSAFVWDHYRPNGNHPFAEAFLYERNGGYDFGEIRNYYDALWSTGQAGILSSLCMADAMNVQFWLRNFGSYSQNLDPLPEGSDPVDYFLGTSETGYCVHYASAAVLMLQQMGVPARYASGYVAFPSDFEKEKGGDGYTARVTDARAHAWAEIYLEDFGWLPIEVTPGFADGDEPEEDVSEGKDGSEKTNGDAQTDDQPEDTRKEPEEEEQETPETKASQKDTADPQKQAKMSREARQALYCLAGLLAAALCLYAVCHIARARDRRCEEQIKKMLQEGRCSAAANQMNRRVYSRLKRRTAGIRVIDDESYRKALEELDASVDAERYIRLVKKAYFSDCGLSQEEAYALYRIYLSYRETLKRGRPARKTKPRKPNQPD